MVILEVNLVLIEKNNVPHTKSITPIIGLGVVDSVTGFNPIACNAALPK